MPSSVVSDDLLRSVRAVKLEPEVERIREAVAVATAGIDAATVALRSGSTEADVAGTAVEAMGRLGSTVPASEPVVRRLGDGAAVVDLGVIRDGYEGGCGRTVLAGDGDDRVERAASVHAAVVAACTAEATGREVRDAAAGAMSWLVRGSGMGFEPPVVTDTVGDRAKLVAGMVLSVEVDVAGFHHRDLVLVGDDRATVLTHSAT